MKKILILLLPMFLTMCAASIQPVMANGLVIFDGDFIIIDQNEIKCLTDNIYHEGRSESVDGQKHIAIVTIKRMLDVGYPNTICGVVYHNATNGKKCAFSWVCDGLSDTPNEHDAYVDSWLIAQQVLYTEFNDIDWATAPTHYHRTDVSPFWSTHERVSFMYQIGVHKFYSEAR